MKIRRRARLDYRLDQQKMTRDANGVLKRKETARRDARIAAKIKATPDGTEYSPEVKSWIASKLGKPAGKASADEIQALLA